MRHRNSSSDSSGRTAKDRHRPTSGPTHKQQDNEPTSGITNIRTNPPHLYDNITRRLIQLGATLAITTFIGLIVRYAVQEFDPSVSTITVTTARVNNRDIASLSVSKNFLERILSFVGESISIVAVIIPLGFPLCTLFNRHFARIRAGASRRFDIKCEQVLNMTPKYLVIGDSCACLLSDSGTSYGGSGSSASGNGAADSASSLSTTNVALQHHAYKQQQQAGANQQRLRPLVRDTIYHLIKARLKPKLIVEDTYDEARKLGIRIGLIGRNHHKLAVIRSVDLLKQITDSRGDIKQAKVRYLLSRMKIMSQSTPADKSLLVYLMKHCETMPNEHLAYLGATFTDPEAMKLVDCALVFADCDDDDVKRAAHVEMKTEPNAPFTDIYLFLIVCLITSNITQSYALYQISAAVSACIYRFLSITVFQEQLLSHSQFVLLILAQQVLAIVALMTKWLASLPRAHMRSTPPGAEMSTTQRRSYHHRSSTSLATLGGGNQPRAPPTSELHVAVTPINAANHRQQNDDNDDDDDTLNSSNSLDDDDDDEQTGGAPTSGDDDEHQPAQQKRRKRKPVTETSMGSSSMWAGPTVANGRGRVRRARSRQRVPSDEQPIHLSGIDLDMAIINSKIATNYKQTFHNTSLLDDVTYRLVKLHIAYQVLVMIIIMIFGNAMFQLNETNNNRQHQTLAFNSLVMNNIFNLANCFNQFGEFNLKAGVKNHPFFLCVLLLAVALQICLTELNAFQLENLNPTQWFVCFVFAFMSALIAPLTGQQRSQRYHKQKQQLASTKAALNSSNQFVAANSLARQHQQQHHHHTGGAKPTTSASSLATSSSTPKHHHYQQQQHHHHHHRANNY